VLPLWNNSGTRTVINPKITTTAQANYQTGSSQLETLFSVEEIALNLKVHQSSVRRWIRAGDLKSKKIGSSVRISLADLRDFIGSDT
jgi:excisionase family DNA binding protein